MRYECMDCGHVGFIVLGSNSIIKAEPTKINTTCPQCSWVNQIVMQIKCRNESYRDKKWLQQKYEKDGLSMQTIGDYCGVSAMTIHIWLNKHGIETRKRGYNKN